jgi:cyclophilin family peptidyl-prolyl cis-trans isomerase
MKKSIVSVFLLLSLTGCGHQVVNPPSAVQTDQNVVTDEANPRGAETQNKVVFNNNSESNSMNLEIDQNKTYTAVLHTSEGDIEVLLNAKETPITVNNFVTLSKKDFYNSTIFHRVMKGFMIQGGDPTGTGSGGPGYKFNDEPFEGEYTRGTLAMANAGKNTNGSQFFIMHADVPLRKDYVIFGHVTKGIEVVDKIATAKVEYSQTREMSKPVNPVKITSVDIIEK